MSTFSFATWQDTSVLCVINTNWLLLTLVKVTLSFQDRDQAPMVQRTCHLESCHIATTVWVLKTSQPFQLQDGQNSKTGHVNVHNMTAHKGQGMIKVLLTLGKEKERGKKNSLHKRKNKYPLFSLPWTTFHTQQQMTYYWFPNSEQELQRDHLSLLLICLSPKMEK